MTNRLVVPRRVRTELRAFLLGDPDLERLAIGFAGRHSVSQGYRLLLREFWAAEPSDYRVQTGFHLEMDPAFWARAAKRARSSGESLVVFHSHPGDPDVPSFSPSDDWGETQLMPKLTARASGPHATVVWSPGGTSARLHAGRKPTSLAVHGVGESEEPIESDESEDPIYARQTLALGRGGQRLLRALRVGVVGAGGTGSHVVQQLLHLGVGHLTVVEPDNIELSNLSRVVGATERDALADRPKTAPVRRLARELGRRTRLRLIEESVIDRNVADRLLDCDVIVGCTDTHWSRFVLNAIAHSYYIPVIDIGVELPSTGSMGARVSILGPDDACLWCSGVLDEARIRAEQMPPALRGLQVRMGYVPDLDVPSPAVVSINGVVASLAVTELLDRVVGFRGNGTGPSMLVYRLADGTVRRVGAETGGCPTCTLPARGSGDLAQLPVR